MDEDPPARSVFSALPEMARARCSVAALGAGSATIVLRRELEVCRARLAALEAEHAQCMRGGAVLGSLPAAACCGQRTTEDAVAQAADEVEAAGKEEKADAP